MKKVVAFGDYMLRLNPPGYLKFIQSNDWHACFTGAEANVCTSLAYMNVPVEYVTRLPNNDISRCAVAALNKYKIGTQFIARGGDRMGIYFIEKGAAIRSSRVTYDRMNSAFTQSQSDDYNWNSIFSDADVFFFSGITLALGENLVKICMEACKCAKKLGVKIVFDINFRSRLWSFEKSKEVIEQFLPYIDLLISNESHLCSTFDIDLGAEYSDDATLFDHDRYEKLVSVAREKLGVENMAITIRQTISAFKNIVGAVLANGDKIYFSKKREIDIVDRVGGGDAFSSGLIYAQKNDYPPQKCIEFAAAASAIKHTIEYDMNLSDASEINLLMEKDGGGNVLR